MGKKSKFFSSNFSNIISVLALILSLLFGIRQCQNEDRILSFEEYNNVKALVVDKVETESNRQQLSKLTNEILIEVRKYKKEENKENGLLLIRKIRPLLEEGISNKLLIGSEDSHKRWSQSIKLINGYEVLLKKDSIENRLKEAADIFFNDDFNSLEVYILGVEEDLKLNSIQTAFE